MKTLLCALAIALLPCAIPAHADEPASLIIPCPANHLPKEADIVRVFDRYNFDEISNLRQRVLAYARHACRPGVGFVRIVAAPEPQPQPEPPRALAKR